MTLEHETEPLQPARSGRRVCVIMYADDGVLGRPDILSAIATFLGVDSLERGELCVFLHDFMQDIGNGISAFARELTLKGRRYQKAAIFLSNVAGCPDMSIFGYPVVNIPWEVYAVAEELTGNSDQDFQLVDSSKIRQCMPEQCVPDQRACSM